MPRQSRSRPSARPASSSSSFGSSGQTRSASTAAYPGTAPPPTYAPAQARPQEKQPGLFAQMAATAGSVAVGSTLGHGLSNMLFGGRSEAPPPAEYQQPVQQQQQYQPQNSGLSCDFQAKGSWVKLTRVYVEFTKCMETGDINTCGWYLEQLKACQAAARPY
ncbi:hypothetical protein FRC06_009545 [Ceratobasidium sp. 370]|nr:hypothetical protein FRC06_009545 [Ceratobasidium sp. 370]